MGRTLILTGLIEMALDHGDGLWRVFAQKCLGEAWKRWEEIFVEGTGQGGERRREKGCMSKRDQFSGGGGADCSEGSVARGRRDRGYGRG